MIFSTRSFWREMCVPDKQVKSAFVNCLGDKKLVISNRDEAISYLKDKLSLIQTDILDRIKSEKVDELLTDLFKIHDECFHFYKNQKEARKKLKEMNLSNGSAFDQFEVNRNIAKNIIDSTNVWIENSVLYQEVFSDGKRKEFNFDNKLLLDIYLYGVLSQSLSLVTLCSKFEKDLLFNGLTVDPQSDIPVQAEKEHPIIYFNTALLGNQNILSDENELKDANGSAFGLAFKSEFGLGFLHFITLMNYIQKYELSDGQIALKIIDTSEFVDIIEHSTIEPIKSQTILNNFTLTKQNVKSQLRKAEPVIWTVGANRYRNELCPFVKLDNNRVMLSYCNIQQAIEIWISYFYNGGMIYTVNARFNCQKAAHLECHKNA